ncbi:hypothetical protein [Methanosarcina vacuolata]|uniref:hypothetical protein n=1 Tax=Methanosarcina vacuolata TaxID=2215 RepID=UPI00064EF664|nr:hypothetical protein [Methanosarcina vacuolata]
MSHTVKCEIKCKEHNICFKSPIFFGTPGTFTSAITYGNIVSCPIGGEMIPCNKDNMRFQYRDDNGRVFHEEGKDTF